MIKISDEKTALNARKSYFFGKGQSELSATIKDAWQKNKSDAERQSVKAKDKWADGETDSISYLIAVFWGVGSLATMLAGSATIGLLATLHILLLSIVYLWIYLCFLIVWFVEQVFLFFQGIFLICPDCGNSMKLPVYICPNCAEEHDALHPSSYGILSHRCNCGEKLPCTFFNGREELEAHCPHDNAFMNSEIRKSRKSVYAFVGAVSAGKTFLSMTLLQAIIGGKSKSYLDKIKIYGQRTKKAYEDFDRDVIQGTNVPRKTTVSSPKAMTLLSEATSPPEFLYFFDPAGESFRMDEHLKSQYYLGGLSGIIFVLDPFFFSKNQEKLATKSGPPNGSSIPPTSKSDDPQEIITRLMRGLENAGVSDQLTTLKIPMAIVVSKTDLADINNTLGESVVHTARRDGEPEQKTRDGIIRQAIIDWGGQEFIRHVETRCANVTYFATSAWSVNNNPGDPRFLDDIVRPFDWLTNVRT